MCALPLPADPSPATSETRVVGCERVEVGSRSALVRVAVALGGGAARHPADVQLVVLIDGVRERRQRPLPAPAEADATALTFGFAVTRRAKAVALELDGRSHALPEPVVRLHGTVALAQTDARAASPDAVEQLRTTRARLEEARSTGALLEAERDLARQAAARAEAAAHDATARAEALAGGAADGAVAPRRLRHSPRRAAVAFCALGSAALVWGVLVWPAGDGARHHGVSDVAAATSRLDPPVPVVSDPLAQYLQIPAPYLALYRQTGARYGLDWTRLAAVGAIESHHGQSREDGVASGVNRRGASGPAQFLAGTWERFGVDGDGDGRRDPHDPADAIAAMASYLRASGAPQDWHGALRAYNHSDAYAAAVERLAARYRRAAP
ncbi:MAG: hypothetical protein QOG42_1941 [Solirubrobacteraceae bacterium]|nr:hypothetical protein [Solirubrobacteraceae bacterium]